MVGGGVGRGGYEAIGRDGDWSAREAYRAFPLVRYKPLLSCLSVSIVAGITH